MLMNGIDTTIRDLIAQLPKGINAGTTNPDDFEKLIAPLAAQITSAIVSAVTQPAAPATGASSGTSSNPTSTTSSAPDALNPKTHLNAYQLSLLRDQDAPMLEQLSNVGSGDPQYNQHESVMRDRLNLNELEHQLQDSAASLHVTYDRSDLDGVLRHAGYDSSHLGSSERYMAAVEKYMGEARTRYQERATNIPNQG